MSIFIKNNRSSHRIIILRNPIARPIIEIVAKQNNLIGIDETLLKFPIQDSRVAYLNGFRVDMVHGDLLTSDILNVERGDILMFGHTHVYMLKKEDGVIYFNPGSTSFPKNGNPATYGVMDGMHLEIRKLDDDLPVKFLDLF